MLLWLCPPKESKAWLVDDRIAVPHFCQTSFVGLHNISLKPSRVIYVLLLQLVKRQPLFETLMEQR